MKIGDEVYIHGYVDEIRQNVVIIRNDGGYFGTVAEEITNKIPNTCGDAISRQAVLKIIDGWYDNNRDTENIEDLIVLITYMSSVTPQQRMGRWIIKRDSTDRKYGECSECMMRQYVGSLNYCPNCGAKMEDVKDES